jgi:hypothetical protein
MRSVVLWLIFVLFATSVSAQSPSVGAAVGLDVSRFDRVEADGFNGVTAGGEAIAFSLRLGTPIGQRWGVELAVTRPSEVERESSVGFPRPLTAISAAPIPIPIPTFEARTTIERRNTTLDTVLWVSQPAGSRVDLVYLGGLAFSRIVEDIGLQFTRRLAGTVVPNSTRTITYGVGPVAGMEARIGLTDHVSLVPGVRLHGIGGRTADGWLLRTSAGLAWQF